MKTENNGKIAIAVVAMFVVALSIVGFTYAYFTAQVKGNTADKSVDVTAGRLEIHYANGNEILAQNLVPGWMSDGKSYYDSVCSSSATPNTDGVYEIKAVSTDIVKDGKCSTTDTRVPAVASPAAADGIASPVTFNVSNTTDNTGDNSYIIRLKDITNELTAAEQQKFFLTLYNGSTVVWSGNLAATGTQVIVPAAITLTKDATAAQEYSINLVYQNTNASQDDSKNKTIKATVEIIGVVKNNDNKWVDADGNEITFPAENTTVPKNDLTVTP